MIIIFFGLHKVNGPEHHSFWLLLFVVDSRTSRLCLCCSPSIIHAFGLGVCVCVAVNSGPRKGFGLRWRTRPQGHNCPPEGLMLPKRAIWNTCYGELQLICAILFRLVPIFVLFWCLPCFFLCVCGERFIIPFSLVLIEVNYFKIRLLLLTSTQSRRLVRRKGASWSLHWPSGANLLAHMQLKCILYVPLWLLCTCLSLFLGEY